MQRFDLAVIGGGSAGQTAATIGAKVGARVLLVDRERLGGDCLHHGCVPSKALIKCAKVAHAAREADRFGVKVAGLEVDFEGVMAYVHDAIHTVGLTETPEVFEGRGVKVAFGGAVFEDAHRIRVGQETFEADKFVLAVGSSAQPPPVAGLSEAMQAGRAIDHVGLFELKHRPERLLVLGGGPIGVEMGQALARLGAQVTLLQRAARIMDKDDPELADLLLETLRKEMSIHTRVTTSAVRLEGDSIAVDYERQGKSESVSGDLLLVATGRKPNLDELRLTRAGVTSTPRGIQIDASLRTTAKHIYAAGDCTGSYQFTHFAETQARVAARNALFAGNQSLTAPIVPWATFCDPELAQIGLSQAQAKEQGLEADVYRFGYDELDRAVCEGQAQGLAKMICAPNGKILGASILGPAAGEAIDEIAVAMKARLPIHKVAQAIHVYPTMNRIVRRLGDQRFMDKGVGRITTKLFGRFKGIAS
jgi:pyruvate/2-oxoglutarate dehydrogenase complex dihydrolipoamide dehydrogenase (E3) component